MIKRSLREALGDIYLSTASKLPDTDKGTIGILQTIEKGREEGARKAFERTKPPQNLESKIISIRMMELFTIDGLDKLVEEISSYFPNIDGPLRSNKFTEQISNYSERLLGTSSMNVGTFVGSKRAGLFGTERSVLKKLPDEIKFVRVGLVQFLPSYFALTLDAYVTSEVNDKLISIRDSMPKARVKFKQLFPRGRMAFSHASGIADYEITRLQNQYLRDLRQKTLEAFPEMLELGFFYSRGKELPYVEIFQMDGLPGSEVTLEKWIQESSHWLTTSGFNFIGYSYFIGEKLIYCSKDSRRRQFIANRVILRKRKFVEDEEYDGDEIPEGVLMMKIEDFHRSFDGAWMILHFLEITESLIAQFRRKASSLQVLSPLSPFHFLRVFRLHGDIVRMDSIFERLKLEYKQIKKWIQSDLKELDDLRNPRLVKREDPSSLGDVINDTIDYRIKVLGKHIQITLDSFSRYLSLQNTAAIYWLTLIALLIGIVALLQALPIPIILQWITELIESFLPIRY